MRTSTSSFRGCQALPFTAIQAARAPFRRYAEARLRSQWYDEPRGRGDALVVPSLRPEASVALHPIVPDPCPTLNVVLSPTLHLEDARYPFQTRPANYDLPFSSRLFSRTGGNSSPIVPHKQASGPGASGSVLEPIAGKNNSSFNAFQSYQTGGSHIAISGHRYLTGIVRFPFAGSETLAVMYIHPYIRWVMELKVHGS